MRTLFTILTILYVFTSAVSQAQTLNYAWAANANQSGEYCSPVQTAFDQAGNAYLLVNYSDALTMGSLSIPAIYEFNQAVICFSPSGLAQWFASAGSNDGAEASSMKIDHEGNIIVGGWYTNSYTMGSLSLSSETNDPQKLRHEFFLAKLNASGQWQWARKQAGDAYSEIKAIDTDQQGNVYAGGFYVGDTFQVGTESLDAEDELPFVSKYSSSGEPIWLRGPVTSFGATLSDLIVLPDGNVCIAGDYGTYDDESVEIQFGSIQLVNEGDPEEGLTASNVYVACLNNTGTFLWAKQAGSILYESFSGSLAADQNKIYLSGSFQEEISIEGTAFSESASGDEGDTDFFIACLDFSGNWQWLLGLGTADEDGIPGLTSSQDHLIYVFGRLSADTLHLGSDELSSSGQNTSFVGRILGDGNWAWAFVHPDVDAFAVKTTNQMLFTGTFAETLTLGDITLNSTSNSESGDTYLAYASYQDQNPQYLARTVQQELNVFPNPANRLVQFTVPEHAGIWTVFALDGRCVAKGSFEQSSSRIDLGPDCSKGIYLLQVMSRSGKPYQAKLLVE